MPWAFARALHWRAGALVLGVLAAGASSVAGQATTYVPALDRAYEDLNLLATAGLADVMLGQRPFSRAAFRGFVDQAEGRITKHPQPLRVTEALARLRARFAPDGADAGPAALRPAGARLDVAASRSPDRPYRTGADGSIDGSVNPLLQRNQGRVLVDGLTTALEGGLALVGGPVAAEVVPRVYLGAPRGADGTQGSIDVQTAYARALAGPVAFEVGRVGPVWGFGAEGGAMLSTNARGLDMVRVSSERSIRLPGFLRALGQWQGSFGIADLGSARDTPGARMASVRVSGRVNAYLEGGASYFNIQGGEGAPHATFGDRVRDFLLLPLRDTTEDASGLWQISDKVVGVDARFTLPSARSALYVNFFTTDDRYFFSQPAKGYWEDATWLVGVEALGVGSDGRLDLRVEWRHNGARAHTHHQFTSGVTLDGRVLGEALGPNAAGVSAGVAWNGPASRLNVQGAWERYSGDFFRWESRPAPVWSSPWYRVSDNPDEVRTRLAVDYLRFEGWRGLETSLGVGYEHVTRFNYTEERRHNLLAQASLRYVW